MISDQGQSLVRDKLIEPSDSRKFLRIKNANSNRFSPKFLYQGKNVKDVEPDFFIVNVAHGKPKNTKFNIMNNSDFPKANRNK